jgi:RNA-directed DNA polymerase
MSATRQKTFKASMAVGTGEAGTERPRGSEALAASPAPERPTSMHGLMEEVCERENLRQALKRVKANKGAAGVDGMTVAKLPDYLKTHWPTLKAQLITGAYRPQPVKRVDIPKPDGGRRPLGIPTVVDRFIQQAVMQVLQRYVDPTFSDSSFGFRPNRSAHQAVAHAQRYIAQGHRIVVDLDLKQFFDRVNHDILMSRVAKRFADARVRKLIRAYLSAGIIEGGLVQARTQGTPQGSPLSPLLSNLLLDDLDKELERRGHRFVRYADDCNIYVRSERAGSRVKQSITSFLSRKLRLVVNEEKSAVAAPKDRAFLGFSFTGGENPRRRIAPSAIARFKRKVHECTSRTRGISLEQMIRELAVYLNGWRNYFALCETPSTLTALEQWVRRRLRCAVWQQWKRGRTRYAELRRRGVSTDLAAQTAGSPHGPWRLSASPALNIALPNAYLRSLGLPSLAVA